MTVRDGIGVMLKSNCVKEKCRFYDDVSECAIDCCMYGASVEDEEEGITIDSLFIEQYGVTEKEFIEKLTAES